MRFVTKSGDASERIEELEQQLNMLENSRSSTPARIWVMKDIEFRADSFPKNVRRPIGISRVHGVFLGQLVDVTDSTAISTAPYIDWAPGADGQIQIKNITGVTVDHAYRATILVVGE